MARCHQHPHLRERHLGRRGRCCAFGDLARRCDACSDRRFRGRAPGKGRIGRRTRWSAVGSDGRGEDRSAHRRRTCGGGRHRRNRRRRFELGQRVDHGRHRHRSSWCTRVQTRQSIGLIENRGGGCPRDARCCDRADPGGGGSVHARGRYRLLLRPRFTQRFDMPVHRVARWVFRRRST